MTGSTSVCPAVDAQVTCSFCCTSSDAGGGRGDPASNWTALGPELVLTKICLWPAVSCSCSATNSTAAARLSTDSTAAGIGCGWRRSPRSRPASGRTRPGSRSSSPRCGTSATRLTARGSRSSTRNSRPGRRPESRGIWPGRCGPRWRGRPWKAARRSSWSSSSRGSGGCRRPSAVSRSRLASPSRSVPTGTSSPRATSSPSTPAAGSNYGWSTSTGRCGRSSAC